MDQINGFDAVEYQKTTATLKQYVWREVDKSWSARLIRRADSVMLAEALGDFRTRHDAIDWCVNHEA